MGRINGALHAQRALVTRALRASRDVWGLAAGAGEEGVPERELGEVMGEVGRAGRAVEEGVQAVRIDRAFLSLRSYSILLSLLPDAD